MHFENLMDENLANASAGKAPIAFHPHLPTAKKVRHRGDGFFGIFSAGTDGDDEVTERKFRSSFQDLSILFHTAHCF